MTHATARRVRRHRLPVRLWHWFNLWCLIVLLMSGLQIFNAHPALYWGSASDFSDPWLEMYAIRGAGGEIQGQTALGPWVFDTTGVLGYSGHGDQASFRGFPAWLTLPSHQYLTMGRLWHFFFAWLFAGAGAIFALYVLFSGHLRRDLWLPAAQWRGPVLADLLDRAGVGPRARYVVFHCMDQLGGEDYYYESLDLNEARHPQTILAYSLNDEPLPIANGAPLRLRAERQLGYKMAKYLSSITLVESFESIAGGAGGYWEDRGYTWYAGI
ncbi:molybdopterin-dependent oxidoreductase [Salinicola acroporae]|uniref:molybdopterin-dependent oxidoreductase n=1 Tax=Salinicola acroporae TaxID=1541440 RepID=UPI000DA21CCB|nr:molybdopterin-dependent oxidoreductase [Salinicola acroporae]